MTNLKNEYTDTRNVKHKVQHVVASDENADIREQVIAELFNALTRPVKPDKRISA